MPSRKVLAAEGDALRIETYPKDLTDFTILVKKSTEVKPEFFTSLGSPPDLARVVLKFARNWLQHPNSLGGRNRI